MPPLALPGKEHMSRAKEIWDEMGLPKLNVQMPWHGYSLGAWHKIWDEAGHRAATGDYLENGRISKSLSVVGLKPETKLDPDSGKPFKSWFIAYHIWWRPITNSGLYSQTLDTLASQIEWR